MPEQDESDLERGDEEAVGDWMEEMNQYVALQERCEQAEDPWVKEKLQ